jgi:hypothetical protein
MSMCDAEPTLTDVLSDPVIQAVMAADGVDPGEVEALVRRVSRRIHAARAGVDSGLAGLPA